MDAAIDIRGLERDVSLAPLTTLEIGGPAAWYLEVESLEQLAPALSWARKQQLNVLYLSEGSNLLVSDSGFPGLVVRNRIRGVDFQGEEVTVGGGENLCDLIRSLNARGLAGMERMFGIPGSVAGALVGNAGAYGQEIGVRIVSAAVWSPRSGVQELAAPELDLRYRHSILKQRRDWFLVSCRMRMERSQEKLQEISDEILVRRLEKYPAGLRSPGSFFKNVPVEDVSPGALARVPEEFIMYGKIVSGRLLEAAGANGSARGGARFAHYHGNLLVNQDGASADDMLTLANEYAGRVWEHFGIRLEPEIRILSERAWPHLEKGR